MYHPPFCPNSECSEHWHESKAPRPWWVRDGTFLSRRSGRVGRFRCKMCGCKFSESTFSLDYFSKKAVDLRRVRLLLTNGSSIRAAGRQLHVSPTAITRRVMILARQSLCAHGRLGEDAQPAEDLVTDGFQSFWVSQYHPNNFTLLAGAGSQYLFDMTEATLRRAGRMSCYQKLRRQKIEARDRTDPAELSRSFHQLLSVAETLWERMKPGERVLRSDEHKVYSRALRQVTVSGVRHIQVSSLEPRTVSNPLFAVNYLDREIRKDLAEHHRETVCFARNAALSTARMWIYLVSHNIDKAYRISPRQEHSHAEAAGISREKVARVRRAFYTQRSFLSRSRLTEHQRRVWMGMLHTPERENRINVKLTPAYCTA